MPELRCPLRETALAAGRSPAVIGPEQTVSYEQLDRLVSAAASQLKTSGCGEGERIALRLPNGLTSIVLILALLRTRATACLLNTRLPFTSLRTLLPVIRCGKLIAPDNPALRNALPEIRRLDPETLTAAPVHEAHSWTDCGFDADQPATIMFTSGSQGTAKAVLHSYGNHWYNASGANENIPLKPGDRWLLALPLFHVGGLGILFRCLLGGAAVVLTDPGSTVEHTISRYGVTHVSMVPTQLYRSLRAWEKTNIATGLKAVLLGGAPIPLSLVHEGRRLGLPLFTSYGMTEMASQVTTTAADTPVDKLASAGKALPHRRIAIHSNGEILVQGKTLFLGYVEGDGVKPTVDSSGWFATGDLGQLDTQGYLTVLGRRDNMFVSGGENIHPEEIERALCNIEGVEQAIVVAVPDEEFGERPFAFVQMAGQAIDPMSLAGKLGSLLPRYKIPVGFRLLSDLEATARLKPQRSLLKRQALAACRESGS